MRKLAARDFAQEGLQLHNPFHKVSSLDLAEDKVLPSSKSLPEGTPRIANGTHGSGRIASRKGLATEGHGYIQLREYKIDPGSIERFGGCASAGRNLGPFVRHDPSMLIVAVVRAGRETSSAASAVFVGSYSAKIFSDIPRRPAYRDRTLGYR
jgi:hypothetical protein